MYLKKRQLEREQPFASFKRSSSDWKVPCFSNETNSFQFEIEDPPEPTLSKTNQRYCDVIDKHNRKIIKQLMAEHQLFLEVVRAVEAQSDSMMVIERI